MGVGGEKVGTRKKARDKTQVKISIGKVGGNKEKKKKWIKRKMLTNMGRKSRKRSKSRTR